MLILNDISHYSEKKYAYKQLIWIEKFTLLHFYLQMKVD